MCKKARSCGASCGSCSCETHVALTQSNSIHHGNPVQLWAGSQAEERAADVGTDLQHVESAGTSKSSLAMGIIHRWLISCCCLHCSLAVTSMSWRWTQHCKVCSITDSETQIRQRWSRTIKGEAARPLKPLGTLGQPVLGVHAPHCPCMTAPQGLAHILGACHTLLAIPAVLSCMVHCPEIVALCGVCLRAPLLLGSIEEPCGEQ